MIDAQPRCGNPACGLPIVVLAGHRRRQYCNDACRMAAHRARVIAENQARDAALQLQLALHEREVWRERFGDLLPASLDLLRHLRITYSKALAEQMAAALRAERDEGRKSWRRSAQPSSMKPYWPVSSSISRSSRPRPLTSRRPCSAGARFAVAPALNSCARPETRRISSCRSNVAG